MEIEVQIQQEAQRARAAFEGFKGFYSATNPPPVQKLYQQDNFWIKAALGVVLVASIIVSGSHTIPTFADGDTLIKGVVGVSAFFMVEVAIVALEFIRTQRHYRIAREEPASLGYFIVAGLVVAVAVALLGNMEYMLSSHGILITDGLRLIILLGMALSAPLLAFLVGGVLAMYAVMDRVGARRHHEAYETEMQGWEDGLRRAWHANKGRLGGSMQIQVDRPVVSNGNSNGIPLENIPVLPSKSSIGHSKQPQASRIVREFFTSNPDALQGDAVEIAQRLGVGKSTVYALMKELKAGEQ